MTLKGGKVGIGTSTPIGLLQVGTNPSIADLIVKSGGNVGIGTTSPGKPLDVFNTAAAGDNVAARFRTNFTSTAGQGVSIEFADISPTVFGKIMSINQSAAPQRALAFSTYTTGGALTEKLRIEGDGNVGIGTTSPLGLLVVGSTTISSPGLFVKVGGQVGIGTTGPQDTLGINGGIRLSANGEGTRGILMGTDASGNTNTGSLLIQAGPGSGGYGGALTLFAYSHATKPGWVTAGIANSAGSGATEGRFTVNDQGLAGGTDVFTVLRTGNVGIGTTSPTAPLTVNGKVFITGAVSTIAATDINIYSDENSGTAGKGVALSYYAPGYWYEALRINNVSSGYGNLVLMKDGGNVGIGTTSPVGLLQVGTSPGAGLAVLSSGSVGIGTTGPGGILEVGNVSTGDGGMLIKRLSVISGTATTFWTTPGPGEWAGVVEITAVCSADVNRYAYKLARFAYDETFTDILSSVLNSDITLTMSGNNMQVNIGGTASLTYRLVIRIMGSEES